MTSLLNGRAVIADAKQRIPVLLPLRRHGIAASTSELGGIVERVSGDLGPNLRSSRCFKVAVWRPELRRSRYLAGLRRGTELYPAEPRDRAAQTNIRAPQFEGFRSLPWRPQGARASDTPVGVPPGQPGRGPPKDGPPAAGSLPAPAREPHYIH